MANPHPLPSPETQFQPGQSGNPGGRPKGQSFTAVLRDLLDREHRKAPDWRSAVAAKALQMAAAGDLDAIKWIADRTDGKVVDTKQVEQSGEIKHVIEVRRTRREVHPPGPAGSAPGPGTDQG